MSRPVLPPKRGTCFRDIARTYAGSPTADGIYFSDEIVNKLGYTKLVLRMEADTEVATSTLDVILQAYNEQSGDWYAVPGAAFAQITGNASTPVDLVVSTDITVVSGRAISTLVPMRMRCKATIATSGADGYTFGVEYELHP